MQVPIIFYFFLPSMIFRECCAITVYYIVLISVELKFLCKVAED